MNAQLYNPTGLNGIEFVEFSGPSPESLEKIFWAFGFSEKMKHATKSMKYFEQNDIHFILNTERGSFAESFHQKHGPCISSMGWRFHDPKAAFRIALERGARAALKNDFDLPAIYGIGDSIIYFLNDGAPTNDVYQKLGFKMLAAPRLQKDKGFICIDHLTNNVPKGTMAQWAKFYEDVFGFQQVRYFDIKGAKTGLTSFALRSPCGKFCIPINEGTEDKSQINEYLQEYKGPGIQHLAFLTENIINSVEQLNDSTIETLDIDEEYYDTVFDRVPNVSENQQKIKKLKILVDGDDEGYLLQIFTKNIIGPIFVEIIQRKNHLSFGEGNFGALFRSIERDQEKRGVL